MKGRWQGETERGIYSDEAETSALYTHDVTKYVTNLQVLVHSIELAWPMKLCHALNNVDLIYRLC